MPRNAPRSFRHVYRPHARVRPPVGLFGPRRGLLRRRRHSGAAPFTTNGAPTIKSIEITPANAHLAAGTKAQLTATAVLSDSTHKDVTAQVAWASSNPTAATISTSAMSNGMATALSTGSTTISASTSGVIGSDPAGGDAGDARVDRGDPAESERRERDDGTIQGYRRVLGPLDTGSDFAGDVVLVGPCGRHDQQRGRLQRTRTGERMSAPRTSAQPSTAVTSPDASLTVTAATLVSIAVTPPSPSIAKGLTQQFTATGTYTDNSTQNLTTHGDLGVGDDRAWPRSATRRAWPPRVATGTIGDHRDARRRRQPRATR